MAGWKTVNGWKKAWQRQGGHGNTLNEEPQLAKNVQMKRYKKYKIGNKLKHIVVWKIFGFWEEKLSLKNKCHNCKVAYHTTASNCIAVRLVNTPVTPSPLLNNSSSGISVGVSVHTTVDQWTRRYWTVEACSTLSGAALRAWDWRQAMLWTIFLPIHFPNHLS